MPGSNPKDKAYGQHTLNQILVVKPPPPRAAKTASAAGSAPDAGPAPRSTVTSGQAPSPAPASVPRAVLPPPADKTSTAIMIRRPYTPAGAIHENNTAERRAKICEFKESIQRDFKSALSRVAIFLTLVAPIVYDMYLRRGTHLGDLEGAALIFGVIFATLWLKSTR